MDKQLLDLALEALAKHKDKISRLDDQYRIINGLTGEMKESHKESIESIDKKIEVLLSKTDSAISSAVNAIEIPIPKNGLDFNPKIAEAMIEKQFKDYVTSRDLSIDDIKKTIKDFAGTLQPKEILLRKLVMEYVLHNSELYKSKDGKKGKDGLDGKSIKGKAGKDAIGIEDITLKNKELVIVLTDGSVKHIPLPEVKGEKTIVGSAATGRSAFISNSKDVRIHNGQDGDVLTFERGMWINKAPVDAQPGESNIEDFARIEIESLFKLANDTGFKELTYSNGNIISINIYATAAKTVKLFTKTIEYNVNNDIESTHVIDEVNGGILSKTIAYDAGNISSITLAYTP